MEWRGKAGGRRPGGGGGRDGRLRIAALVNDRAAVRVLGSASLRADAEDHRRAGTGGPGGRRPEVGCGRDGRRRMTALVNSRAAVRLLGSASLRGDAVGSRRSILGEEEGAVWAALASLAARRSPPGLLSLHRRSRRSSCPCSAQDVATSRPSAICGRRTPESVLRAAAAARPTATRFQKLSGMVRVSDVPHWTKSTGTIPP